MRCVAQPFDAGLQSRDLVAREVESNRAQLGDDSTVAARRVGLAMQRRELAPHLAYEVVEPQQVAFGRLEATFGALAALPVLQHTRGFLDDRPPVLGPGVEHCVELALAHDDVLLAPDAGVGQELLDVEEPARRAVQLVLGVARAKERARDRELRELDREQARGVVDRE